MVDASPYIFRAHFSLPSSIKTPDGLPAAASYGFASFLLKLIADEKPTHLAVAFDRNLNGSFRNEIYPAYKEQRGRRPRAGGADRHLPGDRVGDRRGHLHRRPP